MNESIIIGLIQNIAILVAFAMLYENFWLRNDKPRGLWSKIFTGFIVGLIGTVLMFTPWTMAPGLVFDTRSVMLSVTGVFFGPLPTIIAMTLAGIMRYVIGGEGIWMGIAVIVSSGSIGIMWAEMRKKWNRINRPVEFLALGLVVHFVMLASVFLLPPERVMQTLRTIVIPVFFIYAPGTMLLGMLLAAQKINFQNRIDKDKLYEKEHQLSYQLLENQKKLNEQLEKYELLNNEYRIQNVELTKAKEKAEESDRLKSAFLANLSHEIRTPMNAIIGFADLLESEDRDDETREKYVNIIKNSGSYLLAIINDIVEISQIEAGQVEINEVEVEINEFLDEIYNSFKMVINSRENLKLTLHKPTPQMTKKIKLDEVKLRQMLVNLINNAIKFTEHGEIAFGYHINNAAEISFFVKDTGIGIAPQNHHVIFERFRQLESGNIRVQSGSGLGLSITKAYSEMMGGSISVESEEGKGAKFTLTFPFVSAEIGEVKPVIEKREEQVLTPNGKRVILVAEDEDINWYYIEQVLSRYNYTLIRAENGLEAVDFCKSNENIGLVLMDIKMPVMSGFEALEEIRKINPKLPVIAQTAYALSGEVEKIKSVFDDYITKPINRQLLIEKIAFATTTSS